MKSLKNKFNSMLLCMMLIVAMAFTTIGCADSEEKDASSGKAQTEATASNDTENMSDSEASTAASGKTVVGEGDTSFTFEVVDADGNKTEFEVNTDKETVGEALLDNDLIAGDDSDYGLYVKTVNGITADYDTDGTYWAFYVDGEYASAGVDLTNVTPGAVYSFKVEK